MTPTSSSPSVVAPRQPQRLGCRNWLYDLSFAGILTLLALLLLARPYDQSLNIAMGALDASLQSGLHEPELSTDGRVFRWTNGQSSLILPNQGLGLHIVALTLAAPHSPTPATIVVNNKTLAEVSLGPAPRRYHVLVPGEAAGWPRSTITIESQPFMVAGDTRTLGVTLFGAQYCALEAQPWLLPAQLAALFIAMAVLGMVLRRLGVETARFLVVFLFAAISLAMGHSELRVLERTSAVLLSLGLSVGFAAVFVLLRFWDRQAQTASTPGRQSSSQPEPYQRNRWNSNLAMIGLFAALSALLLAPLWQAPWGLLLGGPGDNFEYAWKLQWFADALIYQRRSPLFQPDFFYPAGFDVARSELTPAHTLLGLPLTLLFGPVAAYNILLYCSYVATGFISALLALRLGARRFGSYIAGIAITYCTFRYTYSLGTLPMAATQWVVLALYGWEGFLQRKRPRDALLGGLGLAFAAWASWYYGATLVLVLAVYTIVRCSWVEAGTLLRAWRTALIAAIVALALVAPYLQPYLALSSPRHNRVELLELAAHPLGYLLPSPFHSLWGGWGQQTAAALGITQWVSIGWGTLLLAMIGLWRWRKHRFTYALIAVAGVAFILSLGPEVRVGSVALPLPVEFIYQYVPGLRNIRVWSRLAFYVQICAGLLAGLALTGVMAWRAVPRLIALLLVGLVLLESANTPPLLSPIAPRAVDHWLAEQPDSGPIMQVPDILSGYGEFYTLYNQRRLSAGYGTFYPGFFLNEYATLQRFPEPRAFEAMQRLGVGYILIRHDLMDAQNPGWRDTLAHIPELQPVYADSAYTVYKFEE